MNTEYQKLIEQSTEQALTIKSIECFCQQHQLTLEQFCNQLAQFISQCFLANQLSFLQSNQLMNSLWDFMSSDRYLRQNSHCLPALATEVYFAFDDGEWVRQGDPADTDPVEQYTRPALERINKAFSES